MYIPFNLILIPILKLYFTWYMSLSLCVFAFCLHVCLVFTTVCVTINFIQLTKIPGIEVSIKAYVWILVAHNKHFFLKFVFDRMKLCKSYFLFLYFSSYSIVVNFRSRQPSCLATVRDTVCFWRTMVGRSTTGNTL